MNLRLENKDCMEVMAEYSDNYFEIALLDPPYGIHDKISKGNRKTQSKGSKFSWLYSEKNWDKDRPTEKYWNEVLRVSKNQIVCGANYFTNFLPISRGWIFWDKMGENLSVVNNELIYTSFDVSIKTFKRCHGLDKGFMNKEGKNIHPTQKPIALYEWILFNYAQKEMKILDTHLGSGSSLIAADKFGVAEFVGCEIDKEYYENLIKRYNQFKAQTVLGFDCA
jgi:site-specific DNA-methyltransferase (adenine-specific)